MRDVAIVIPCYNESDRLDSSAFREFLETEPRTVFTFVDDGSTDGTGRRLREFRDLAPDRISIIDLPENVGKAEAVRQGMLAAMEKGACYAGYWDADLATPLGAIPEFYQVLEEHDAIDVVLGARVRLLGRAIERRPARHYLGRVFATAASLVLGMPVYDTQCGAKLFRVNRRTAAAFFEPFRSRWIFDIEILARLAGPAPTDEPAGGRRPECLYELPLLKWRDIPGSKLRLRDFVIAAKDLAGIYAIRKRQLDPAPRASEAAAGNHGTALLRAVAEARAGSGSALAPGSRRRPSCF